MLKVFPAIFKREEIGYSVSIPDLSGCFSEGDTLDEAIIMIKDAAGLYLYGLEEDREEIPKASIPIDIELEEDECIIMIDIDMLAYRQKHDSKSIKKTLTIPSWLNYVAEENDINFSQTLQLAIKSQLGIRV